MNNSSAFSDFTDNDPFDRLLLVAQSLVRIERDPEVVRNFQAHAKACLAAYPDSERKFFFETAIAIELERHCDAFLLASEGYHLLVYHLRQRATPEGIPAWLWYLWSLYLPDDDPSYPLACALQALRSACDPTIPFCAYCAFNRCLEVAGYAALMAEDESDFCAAIDSFLADFWTDGPGSDAC